MVYLDSYKLVRFRAVLAVIAAAGAVAVACYFLNGWLLSHLAIDRIVYARYLGPAIEEALKALVIVYLFRSRRIGFLVDSAIMGFTLGAGFGFAENLYYLTSDAGLAVFIVRGFGTAIMHGGVVAIFGIVSQTLTQRHMKINPARYLPGLAAATVPHSLFNHSLRR